jgi:hypothetical protein
MFTPKYLAKLGVCREGLDRVAAFGGVPNTPEGWAAYIAAHPNAWTAPVWLAWRMRRAGWAIPGDLMWQIARMGFIAAGRRPGLEALAPYGRALGPDTWRAAHAAASAASAADAAYYAADAAYYAADAAYYADAASAADAADAAYYADAAGAERHAIVALAVAALVAADPG